MANLGIDDLLNGLIADIRAIKIVLIRSGRTTDAALESLKARELARLDQDYE